MSTILSRAPIEGQILFLVIREIVGVEHEQMLFDRQGETRCVLESSTDIQQAVPQPTLQYRKWMKR